MRISINNAKVTIKLNKIEIRTYQSLEHTMKKITLLALILITSACTVKVAAPDKPITINLNVKIEHEVRIKVEKELEDLFSEDSDLF
ncbi:MAG: hypothetical protein ACI971_002609 [Colwellia sp.]